MNLATKVKDIEDQQYSFYLWFLALYSIIFIRNIFESAFEDRQIFGFTAEIANSFYMLFVHYPLFYLSIFVWLLLFLMLITKEEGNKIARVLVIGFSIIIVVPFIDIIISRGSGYKLTYLTGLEAHPVAYKFFDFSRDLLQVTWGQRIEILLAVLGLFGYVFIKTKNLWKSILAAVIVYLIFFIHGLLPNAIAKIPSLFGLNILNYRTIITGGLLPIDSQNYSVIFCLSIFLAGFFILKKIDKDLYQRLINFNPSIRDDTACSLIDRIPPFSRKGGTNNPEIFIIIFLCLGITYGIFLILPYYKFFIYSPIFYLTIILAIITIYFANSAIIFLIPSSIPPFAKGNIGGFNLMGREVLLFALLFFSITLSPIFLISVLLIVLLKNVAVRFIAHNFEFVELSRKVFTNFLPLVFAFLAGSSIIMQSDTFKTIIPIDKQAIEIRGRKLSAWDNLLNGNYTRALSEYSIIYSLTGDNNILKNIGQCYLNLGEIEKAVENLSKVQKPDYQTIISLSWAYAQQGKAEKGIQVYETGIEHNIEPAEFYLKIAQIYARQGNQSAMEIALKRGLKYGAPKYQIYQIKGDYYLSQKDYPPALKMYDKSLFYNTRAAGSYVGKGRTLNILGDYRGALKEFKKALKFDPNNDGIYNNLGVVYIQLGDKEKAIRNFKKSVEINPAFAEAYFNLGLVAEKDNKLDSALVMYEKALKINPQFLPAKQAIERIGKDGNQ